MLYQGLEKEEVPTQGELFGDAMSDGQLTVSSLAEDKSPSHYQYKGKYIMTAVKSGLMIIDQHRAHVRILYERYLQQFSARTAAVQKVLFPETIQLNQSQRVVYEKVAPELQAMGFDLSDLGNGNFAINGIPAGLDGINPVNLILDMVDAAAEGTLSAKADIDASLALTMARASAITHGEVLGNNEMENIVNSLFMCGNANSTPDGKTVLCILKQSEIERLFA